VEDFRICSVDSFKSQFDYMFWENGNMFLLNGKPFLILFHISCGFLKYAWCIFKATQVSIQPDSEKCTGQYFKVRDDDLSKGVIMYIQNDAYKKYSKIFLSIYYIFLYLL